MDTNDLDNYLFPVAVAVTRRARGKLVSVWGTKEHRQSSFIRVDHAVPVPAESDSQSRVTVQTSASASSTGYKQQIHDQLCEIDQLPDGPVRLELAFRVGPRRNWPNLWKPTIDALDGLLGATERGRLWHPRDGRITELGLHCTMDHVIRNEVFIEIAAQTIASPMSAASWPNTSS